MYLCSDNRETMLTQIEAVCICYLFTTLCTQELCFQLAVKLVSNHIFITYRKLSLCGKPHSIDLLWCQLMALVTLHNFEDLLGGKYL